MKKCKTLIAFAGGAIASLLTNPMLVYAAEGEPGLGAKMEKALLNTVMGILIVFCSLVLISLIISLFKYINMAERKFAEKKAAKNPAPVIDTTPAAVEEDLSDDLELVAVITAAIQAYEESEGNTVSADGLVVRSIRKVNKKWQNA